MYKKIPKPKNEWALVIYLLIKHHKSGLTMVDAMKVYFHKFQSRLGEI